MCAIYNDNPQALLDDMRIVVDYFTSIAVLRNICTRLRATVNGWDMTGNDIFDLEDKYMSAMTGGRDQIAVFLNAVMTHVLDITC